MSTTASIEYVMGFEITARPKCIAPDPPPCVVLHRMGGSEASTYFTPEEARRFGEALLRAAQAAETAR